MSVGIWKVCSIDFGVYSKTIRFDSRSHGIGHSPWHRRDGWMNVAAAFALAFGSIALPGCESVPKQVVHDDPGANNAAAAQSSDDAAATTMADLRARPQTPAYAQVERPPVAWSDGANPGLHRPEPVNPRHAVATTLVPTETDPLALAAAERRAAGSSHETTVNPGHADQDEPGNWDGSDVVTLGPGVQTASNPSVTLASDESVPATRAQVLRAAIEELGQTPDEPLRLALDQAAIHAAMGGAPWTESELVETFPNLDPRSRQRVGEYRALLGRLHEEMVHSGSTFDPDPLWRDLEGSVAGEMASVRITDLQLCSSVAGFGQYQPLASDRLLAGINHPAVLYTELDGFQPRQLNDGRFETSLSQEIRIYDDSDDLVVWHRGPESLTDVSNKQRRDFFICQNLTIPANLGVGRYRMKVTIIDQHADTMWEQTLPIEIVADMALTDADPGGWGR